MAQALASVAAIVATLASLVMVGLGVFVASLALRNAMAASRSRWGVRVRPLQGDRYEGVARRARDGSAS